MRPPRRTKDASPNFKILQIESEGWPTHLRQLFGRPILPYHVPADVQFETGPRVTL
jgi:hypothetical protein